MKLLSVVVPVYNESAGIETFHRSLLLPALKKLTINYEIVYVNDGSSDDSLIALTRLAKDDTAVRIVNLSRNFGKEIAVTAGIAASRGDATVIMDADGQHPPKLLREFVKKWRAGAQIVIGVRRSNQKEGVVKRFGSRSFYRLFNASSDAYIVPGSTDFRLIDRVVRDEFLRMTERSRITRGLIDWLGFERAYIEFDAPARIAGKPSYGILQLIRLALNSFISLSLRPLEILSVLGITITLLALASGLFVIIEQILMHDPLHLNITGAAMLGIFITFLVGLVMTSQGIIAIYLAHIHTQTQDRPLYVVNPRGSKRL